MDVKAMPKEDEFFATVAKIEGYDYKDPGQWTVRPQTQDKVPPGPEPPWHFFMKTMFESKMAASVKAAREWRNDGDQTS